MKTTLLGDISDKVGDLAKQAGKGVATTPSGFAKRATSQLGVKQGTEEEKAKNVQGQVQAQAHSASSGQAGDQTKEVVNFLYGKGQEEVEKEHFARPQRLASKDLHGGRGVRNQIGISELSKGQSKSPQEIQEIESLTQKLHKEEYYDPTFNRPQHEEERQAEKVEREEKEVKMEELKKEEEKPKPIAVKRAAERVEKFRGSSG